MASIRFDCPHCGKRLKAPEQSVGQKARCKCGAKVTIPQTLTGESKALHAEAALPDSKVNLDFGFPAAEGLFADLPDAFGRNAGPDSPQAIGLGEGLPLGSTPIPAPHWGLNTPVAAANHAEHPTTEELALANVLGKDWRNAGKESPSSNHQTSLIDDLANSGVAGGIAGVGFGALLIVCGWWLWSAMEVGRSLRFPASLITLGAVCACAGLAGIVRGLLQRQVFNEDGPKALDGKAKRMVIVAVSVGCAIAVAVLVFSFANRMFEKDSTQVAKAGIASISAEDQTTGEFRLTEAMKQQLFDETPGVEKLAGEFQLVNKPPPGLQSDEARLFPISQVDWSTVKPAEDPRSIRATRLANEQAQLEMTYINRPDYTNWKLTLENKPIVEPYKIQPELVLGGPFKIHSLPTYQSTPLYDQGALLADLNGPFAIVPPTQKADAKPLYELVKKSVVTVPAPANARKRVAAQEKKRVGKPVLETESYELYLNRLPPAEVIDIRTGESVGQFPCFAPFWRAEARLSPDGKFLAAANLPPHDVLRPMVSNRGSPRELIPNAFIDIWKTGEAKPITRVNINDAWIHWIGFVSNTEIAVVKSTAAVNLSVEFIHAESGAVRDSVVLDAINVISIAAIQRYFGDVSSQSVNCSVSPPGEVMFIGQYLVSIKEARLLARVTGFFHNFSRDGSQFAIGRDEKLIEVFDTATGALRNRFRFEMPTVTERSLSASGFRLGAYLPFERNPKFLLNELGIISANERRRMVPFEPDNVGRSNNARKLLRYESGVALTRLVDEATIRASDAYNELIEYTAEQWNKPWPDYWAEPTAGRAAAQLIVSDPAETWRSPPATVSEPTASWKFLPMELPAQPYNTAIHAFPGGYLRLYSDIPPAGSRPQKTPINGELLESSVVESRLEWVRIKQIDGSEIEPAVLLDDAPDGIKDAVHGIASGMSSTEELLAYTVIASRHCAIRIANSLGEHLKTFVPYGQEHRVDSIAWIGNDTLVTVGDGRCTAWRYPELTPIADFDGGYEGVLTTCDANGTCAVANAVGVDLIDFKNSEMVNRCYLPIEGRVESISLSPSGRRMAVGIAPVGGYNEADDSRVPNPKMAFDSRPGYQAGHRQVFDLRTFVWDLESGRVALIPNSNRLHFKEDMYLPKRTNHVALQWYDNRHLVVFAGEAFLLDIEKGMFVAELTTLGAQSIEPYVVKPDTTPTQVNVALPDKVQALAVAKRYAQHLMRTGRTIGPGGNTVCVTIGHDVSGAHLYEAPGVPGYSKQLKTPRVYYHAVTYDSMGNAVKVENTNSTFLSRKSRYFDSKKDEWKLPADPKQANKLLVDEVLAIGLGVVDARDEEAAIKTGIRFNVEYANH